MRGSRAKSCTGDPGGGRAGLIRSTGLSGPPGRGEVRPGTKGSSIARVRLAVFVYTWLFSEFWTHLGFLLALVLMAGLLRQRRSPSSTIAWLLVILLLPYIGVPLYIMFGGRKMRRMARRKQPIYHPCRRGPRNRPAAGPWNGCSPRMACRRPRRGNRVELVTSGVDAYRAHRCG